MCLKEDVGVSLKDDGGVSVEDTWLWWRGKTGRGQEDEELGVTPFLISGHRNIEIILNN